jgi:hypothetical protein
MAKTKLWQELDGKKWTFSKKKINLIRLKNILINPIDSNNHE